MAEGGLRPMQPGHAMDCGLAKAFEVLSRASEQRLLSLTYKMGGSRAERLTHAMCLSLLRRNKEALDMLSAHGDSRAGNHLAEAIKAHGDVLNGSHVGGFQISDPETQLDVARVFAVLVQERLCDTSLRDQAYREAIVMSRNAGLQTLDVLEETKKTCGLEAVEDFMQSNMDSKTACVTFLEASEVSVNRPSSLRSSSDCSSHSLEISSPTITESSKDESKPLSLHTPRLSETTSRQDQALHTSDRSTNIRATNPLHAAEVINGSTNMKPKPCLDRSGSSRLVTSKNTNPETGFDFSSYPTDGSKVRSQPANINHYPNLPHHRTNASPADMSSSAEDDTFYAFVILHEPEDADEALRLKEKLESIISGVGATISEDFAEPGRSTVSCMENAINNSAFTLLLLTQNFNTNLSETSTDSAIFNSLENHHKRNSVIPILPRENSLPKDKRRLVLRGTVPLDESSKSFAKAALKAMAPEKVASQKKVWLTEQRIKKTEEEQKRLREEKIRNMDLQRETERLARLRMQYEYEMHRYNMFHAQAAGPRPPAFYAPMHATPQHIHIEHAQNVMIGNNSAMNIDHAPHSSEEED